MNRFGFIDSSGIIKTDQFFGVGFLISKNIGILNDLLVKNYQTALNITKHNKGVAIERLLSQGKEGEIINMLRKNKRFEMKFDYVRHSLFSSYKKMIEIFFSDSQNRFSVIVVNKYDPTFNVSYIHDTWEAYIQYASSLIIREMTNLKENNLCLIIDEISRPKQKTHCIEDAILSKIYRKIQYINREKNLNLDYNKIFGILSIESHSNVFMHLTDVL